ncbi:MAG: DUF2520 domain-containing protein [Dehalococcoidales bacterium]|nr:DUF2520 domain-containing protein [Dehalococcoidales bacterium]
MPKNSTLRLGVIGTGKVGTALAVLLSAKGYPVVAAADKSAASAENLAKLVKGCSVEKDNQNVADAAELIFITTPDDVIAGVAAQTKWHAGQSVVHCSGAASTDILEPARRAGAMIGSLHPLQTIADVKQAIANIPGSSFGIEAEEPLLSTLREMARTLGGTPFELKASDKVAYHIAAVMASNYLVTLIKLSTDLWQTFNIPRAAAVHALAPLIRGTINNIENVGIPQCLTGPIVRGDTGTIEKHLDALDRVAPQLIETYKDLGRQTVPVSVAKGTITRMQEKALAEIFKS